MHRWAIIAYSGLEGGGRYYFSDNYTGPYGEAGAGFISLTLKDDFGNEATETLLYPFTLVGYRWGSSFFVDAGIGGVLYTGKVELNGSTVGTFSRFSPRISLAVGMMF